ncbi:DMT family transporter [Corynebacterium lizhenjunii]|uniref:DMT family transporter n=1 Tax=Corynebacterium lizhenjunii TaxID=2709394 RepID=UPI0013EA24C4|nr:DMT family transporter [Corynebacterium lizhenjunii]
MLGNVIAVLCALASALVVAWGTVVRHRIALRARGNVMRTAMRNPRWWVGTAAAVVAYALQLAALAFGTLLVVQPILVLSLMFTLPLAARYAGRRMPFHEVWWSVVLTVAVAVLVVYGRPTPAESADAPNHWPSALLLGAVALLALGGAGWYFRQQRALALGTACGMIYGYVALLAKAVVDAAVADSLWSVAGNWKLWLLITLAAAGTVVQQYSFHAGPLEHSLPAMTIVEPVVAFGLGYWVLGEQFQVSSAAGWALMAAALAAMAVATVVLSRSPVPASTAVRTA